MRFADVVAQEGVKQVLLRQVEAGRLPHALMLHGPEGAGKMALAMALARRLLCQSPTPTGDCCGQCQACRMTQALQHIDLHFSFPVIKRKSSDRPVSDDFLPQWRQMLGRGPYFTQAQWLAELGAENQQMSYFVDESDALTHKLSIKSGLGGRRVVMMWLPEKLNEQTANKMLKLVEEPPQGVHFIMVSQQPQQVLGTILSRAQQVRVPPLSEDEITQALCRSFGTDPQRARHIAHLAQGSYTRALQLRRELGQPSAMHTLFTTLARASYGRRVKDMRQWSEDVAKMGRERQKDLLEYMQRMTRENFVRNLGAGRLCYLTDEEEQFSSRFAPYVNERNVRDLSAELARCQDQIEQNANPRMVFFDLAIKMTILLRR